MSLVVITMFFHFLNWFAALKIIFIFYDICIGILQGWFFFGWFIYTYTYETGLCFDYYSDSVKHICIDVYICLGLGCGVWWVVFCVCVTFCCVVLRGTSIKVKVKVFCCWFI
jgi:hypothetical protein